MISLVECPRDAWQGIKEFIPTEKKIKYLNLLLEVGFDYLDFGSFVSPKAMPQMADIQDIMNALNLENTSTKLIAIVANERGGLSALEYPVINYIGYPFSVSETFALKNTNKSIEQCFEDIKRLNDEVVKKNKEMIVYISMGFGNPYNEEWNINDTIGWIEKLEQAGFKNFALSDTTGNASATTIKEVLGVAVKKFTTSTLGVHLHVIPGEEIEKLEAAYTSGIRKIDGAILGFGGCPMADNILTGNLNTLKLIEFAKQKGELPAKFNQNKFEEAIDMANDIFGTYH